MPPLPVKRSGPALAGLNTKVMFVRGEGENLVPLYYTHVGKMGKIYPITFNDLMNLVRARCGHVQLRLEHKS
jgi:hypothetical protein